MEDSRTASEGGEEMKVDAVALASAMIFNLMLAFLVVGGALVALAFAGDEGVKIVEGVPLAAHLMLFLCAWMFGMMFFTNWEYVVR